MAQLQVRLENTRDGAIALLADRSVYSSQRPVVVMMHGALRDARVLLDWGPLLRAWCDLVYVELPGHGRSVPIIPAGVDLFAENILQALRSALPHREIVLVGESLGGLVAIAMAGLAPSPVKRVLAADPPLTTAKLWHVANAVGGAASRSPENAFLKSFADQIFGLDPQARSERIYYPLLDRAQIPIHVATGDLALLPPRTTKGVPCVIDDVDRFVMEKFYRDKVQVHVLENCGHLVLADRRAACLDLIRRLLTEIA
jgi:pimeloyl-ACP methyl ester carboxylesterase